MAEDKVQESIAVEHMKSHREDTKPVENAIEESIQSEKAISTWQAIKTHNRILGYALFPFACAMNYGYDTISNGSSIAMPALIISFGAVYEATGSLYLPSLWTSLWTSMSDLDQAIGAFMAGVLGQTVGRRYTALIFAVMSVVGTFLLFFATSRGVLLVGKTINGVVVGGLVSIGTMYAADIATIQLRGAVSSSVPFSLFSVGWSNDKIGRRRLWIYGLIGNFVCVVTVGGLAYSRPQGSYWAIEVILNLLISYGVYATVGVAWTICPEINSHRLRQYSQSVSFFTGAVGGWLFFFVILYMYNVDSGNLGAKTGFIYARLTVIVFAISWFIIPETASFSIEDIDNAYEKSTSPREFGKLRAE